MADEEYNCPKQSLRILSRIVPKDKTPIFDVDINHKTFEYLDMFFVVYLMHTFSVVVIFWSRTKFRSMIQNVVYPMKFEKYVKMIVGLVCSYGFKLIIIIKGAVPCQLKNLFVKIMENFFIENLKSSKSNNGIDEPCK